MINPLIEIRQRDGAATNRSPGLLGTISSTNQGTGVYTAPSSAPPLFTVAVTATSSADPAKSAQALVTVLRGPQKLELEIVPEEARETQ